MHALLLWSPGHFLWGGAWVSLGMAIDLDAQGEGYIEINVIFFQKALPSKKKIQETSP